MTRIVVINGMLPLMPYVDRSTTVRVESHPLFTHPTLLPDRNRVDVNNYVNTYRNIMSAEKDTVSKPFTDALESLKTLAVNNQTISLVCMCKDESHLFNMEKPCHAEGLRILISESLSYVV